MPINRRVSVYVRVFLNSFCFCNLFKITLIILNIVTNTESFAQLQSEKQCHTYYSRCTSIHSHSLTLCIKTLNIFHATDV